MKRAIGSIAVYDDPAKGRVALLQVRKADDSYPACVEKTWGGGADEGERLSEAVCREYGEELRECVSRALGNDVPLPQALAELHKAETTAVAVDEPQEEVVDQGASKYTLRRLHVLRQEGKKLVVTLLCQIHDPDLVAAVQPMIDAGVLLPLTANELDRLIPISGEHKQSGIPEEQKQKGKLGMFPDEIEAVTKALGGMTGLSEEASAEAAATLQRRREEYESEKLAPLMLSEADARQLLTTLTAAIEEKYGYKVAHGELEHPKTGIFDGLTITLHPDLPTYLHCFILLHLFGHSVQWTAPSLEHKLHDLQHTKDKERFMQVLHDYEFEAARFGMQFLHEQNIEGHDQWYSDFVETDWRYVERFYREGKLPKIDECVVTGCPIIEPLPTPEIQHRKVAVRFAF